MKTTARKAALLLATIALLLPALWSCSTSAGDEPGEPTGPTTQYNPEMDYPGAGLTVKASPSTVAPGDHFNLIATFTDAEGRPVVGVPIGARAEAGGVGSQYFSFVTNATITDTRGKASIQVNVASNTPTGSYIMMVFSTTPGPNAHGQTLVMVSGAGTPSLVTLTTSTSSVAVGETAIFTVSATVDCAPIFEYRAVGGGLNIDWTTVSGSGNPRIFTLSPSAVGTLSVIARAHCSGSTLMAYSDQVDVTVGPVAPPTITAPDVPANAAPVTNTVTETFTSGGAVCSNGDVVQYQFTATNSPAEGSPLPWGVGTTANFTWPASAGAPPHVPYPATVTVQARCSSTPSVVSSVISLTITVN